MRRADSLTNDLTPNIFVKRMTDSQHEHLSCGQLPELWAVHPFLPLALYANNASAEAGQAIPSPKEKAVGSDESSLVALTTKSRSHSLRVIAIMAAYRPSIWPAVDTFARGLVASAVA